MIRGLILSLLMSFCLNITMALAQEPVFPRLYAGIHGFASNYTIFYPRESSSHFIASKPVKFEIGYRFTPKLAIQVGVVSTKQSFSSSGNYINPSGQTISFTSRDEQRSLVFPTLLRYTVTHNLLHKIQFDVLAGTTIIRAAYHEQSTRIDDGQVAVHIYKSNKAVNALLSAGPSIRYGIGQHLGLNGTCIINKSLNKNAAGSGVTTSISAGIQYKFLSR